MEKNILYLMVGIPGSGKSTYIQNHLTNKDIWISRDKIRFELISDKDDYFAKENEVFNTFVKKINENLEKGYNVYADATHINKKSRFKLLVNIKNKYNIKIIAIVINTPLEICLKRNEFRSGRARVPDEAIISMYNSLSFPTTREYIDDIKIIEEKE